MAAGAENQPAVVRKDLLVAALEPARAIARVDIKEITLPAGQTAPLHLHPCPVVGVVREGRIAYEIEGEPVRHLVPGDAFYEPAGVRVARFDNEGEGPAVFTAFYMLERDDRELIQMLDR